MYCSVTELKDRFGEQELILLTDRDRTAGAVVVAVAEQSIADAGALIDGYLAGRYALPLPTVPSVLPRLAATIARYLLHDQQASEQVRQQYDDAIRFLERVARGDISLGPSPAGESVATHDLAEFDSQPVRWARDSSQGFI